MYEYIKIIRVVMWNFDVKKATNNPLVRDGKDEHCHDVIIDLFNLMEVSLPSGNVERDYIVGCVIMIYQDCGEGNFKILME